MADPILDLVGGQRSSSFRFDLVDLRSAKIGELAVDRENPPSISFDVNSNVKRSMSGMKIATGIDDINPLTDRVRPMMLLSDGREFPLGVFLFASNDRARLRTGTVGSPTFTDLTPTIDQGMSNALSVRAGRQVATAMTNLMTRVPMIDYTIADTTAQVSAKAPMTWPAGTSLFQVLNDLAAVAGLYSGYFDNTGVLRWQAPQPITDDTDPDLSLDGRVIADSVVDSDDQLTAANRFVVIDSSATDSPVVGVYDLPAEAPNSITNRGFAITTVIDKQGVGTQAQAYAAAKAAAAGAVTYQSVQLDTPPDPRHDGFQTAGFDGAVWREQGWTLNMREGAAMPHTIRRVYSDA